MWPLASALLLIPHELHQLFFAWELLRLQLSQAVDSQRSSGISIQNHRKKAYKAEFLLRCPLFRFSCFFSYRFAPGQIPFSQRYDQRWRYGRTFPEFWLWYRPASDHLSQQSSLGQCWRGRPEALAWHFRAFISFKIQVAQDKASLSLHTGNYKLRRSLYAYRAKFLWILTMVYSSCMI